jgi:ankyrin repeat protein
MHGRKSYRKPFSYIGVAIFLFAGLSQLQPFSLQSVRAGDRRESQPIGPELVRAIRDADSQAVRKLIDDGSDVYARDAEGNTPLILAAFYASPECVALLLRKGADPNAANKAGVTALIRAATNYDKTLSLVNSGARVRVRTAGLGNTPLILAARRAGNSRTVKLLLDLGADATERNDSGVSPIISGAAIWRRCDCCSAPARNPTISRNRMIREPRVWRRVFERR